MKRLVKFSNQEIGVLLGHEAARRCGLVGQTLRVSVCWNIAIDPNQNTLTVAIGEETAEQLNAALLEDGQK